jgi:bifunctional non-homologous end joining protein LigD
MRGATNGEPEALPRFVEPMKARLAAELPEGEGWLFEIKLDGIRAIGIKEGETVRLFSRRPRELTQDYPEIVAAVRRLPAATLVVDGEIVAFDDRGRTSFQALQNVKREPENRVSVYFMIFDMVHLNGADLTARTLVQRRTALRKILARRGPPLRFSVSVDASPGKLWKEILKLGLEGVIAKRKDSTYEIGRRSGAWLKIKAQNQQEFVIGGYTAPRGSRKYFGSLLVGYHAGGRLMFASKVGTGFDADRLRSLYQKFKPYRMRECPFVNLPIRRRSRFGQGISPAEMKVCTWLRPKLVCQVKYLEWTGDDRLRQPVFLGLRDDKEPGDVVREQSGPVINSTLAASV